MSRDPYVAYALEMGHLLKRLRRETGMSQERVAHAAGITAFTYQKYEKGESSPGVPMNPLTTTLLRLSAVFGVEPGDLFPPDPPDLSEGR